jgi:hypothetical protein
VSSIGVALGFVGAIHIRKGETFPPIYSRPELAGQVAKFEQKGFILEPGHNRGVMRDFTAFDTFRQMKMTSDYMSPERGESD